MKSNGNVSARAVYEKAVPPYYYQPQENDCVWVFFQNVDIHSRTVFGSHPHVVIFGYYKHRLLTRQYHRNREKCNYWIEKYIKANELIALLNGFCWSVLVRMRLFWWLLLNHSVLREQWIRAKYERMEFTGETKYPPLPYTTGDVSSQV